MQDSPPKETLLLAVARFLAEELRPQLQDPKLSFRALIAAHLCMGVATECTQGPEQDRAELARLHALLPDLLEGATLPQTNANLAKDIRAGNYDEAMLLRIRGHLKATLREKLNMNNARFDQRDDIEGAP